MNAVAKLISVWVGELPPWLDRFKERMGTNRRFDWELVHFRDVGELNALATDRLGVECRKGAAYAACDYRPAYGELFADRYAGYPYWGWCDLDVVVGDLDRLVAPDLAAGLFDVYSTEWWHVNGAMSLFRNSVGVNRLWRTLPGDPDCRRLFSEPEYENYDECGFNDAAQVLWGRCNRNPSFTAVVKAAATRGELTYQFDGRGWTETSGTCAHVIPTRGCRLEPTAGPDPRTRLIEVPTGRELVLYHFGTRWPLPDEHDTPSGAAERLPANGYPEPPAVDSLEFWAGRVRRAREHPSGPYVLSYDVPETEWVALQRATAEALRRHVHPSQSVLDAGCGHGGLLEALVATGWRGRYTGLDHSPDVVALAAHCQKAVPVRHRRVEVSFVRGDLRAMPFGDGQFDWCVCRGLEGSTKTRESCADWRRMVAEMRRVGRHVLVMNLSGEYEVLQ